MFVVINRIFVAEGHEAAFEERFQNRLRLVQKTPGFVRSILMRPVESRCYVVQVWWENAEAFHAWVDSPAFHEAHRDRPPKEMFAAPNEFESYEILEITEPEA